MQTRRLPVFFASLILSTAASVGCSEADTRLKNVIVMVADGAGFNTVRATGMYQGRLGKQVYDGPEWVRVAASTYPLRPRFSIGTGTGQDPAVVYDPEKAWSTEARDGYLRNFPFLFSGYRFLRETQPDSACTATAIASGVRTVPGRINVDGTGRPARTTLIDLASAAGYRSGVVTSVTLPHATPAAFAGIRSPSRRAYEQIAQAMLDSEKLSVLAGCGHPEYDNNGEPLAAELRQYHYVGGVQVWRELRGELPRRPSLADWTLVDDRKKIEELAEGPAPSKLLIIPRVGEIAHETGSTDAVGNPIHARRGGTLQADRGSRADPRYTPPHFDPPIESVPSLASLTRAALNVLDDDPDGLFLHVEGGAVDWAMHDRQLGRMIEEMISFNEAVEAVVGWVEEHSSWDESLLIVTADHDHMLWGPESGMRPFAPLIDRGPGKLPGHRWLSDSHSNALVPVYARGARARDLLPYADLSDPVRGRYLDQTEIFRAIEAAMPKTPVGVDAPVEVPGKAG